MSKKKKDKLPEVSKSSEEIKERKPLSDQSKDLKNSLDKMIHDLESHRLMYYLFRDRLNEFNKKQYDKMAEFFKNNGEKLDENSWQISVKYATDINKMMYELKLIETANKLTPRNLLISMFAQYDVFFSELLKFIILVHPEQFNSGKAMKYCDIYGYTDLKCLKDFIIEQEIESYLRESRIKQLDDLGTLVGVKLTENKELLRDFIELAQRRNLYTHCNGIISSQYINECNKYGCDIDPNKLGKEMPIDSKYLDHAFRVIFEICFDLTIIIWDHEVPDEKDYRWDYFHLRIIQIINNNEYDLVINILKHFLEKVKKIDQDIKLKIIINLAQSYKWKGEIETCNKTLKKIDWATSDYKFQLGVAVLKDNFVEAFRLMRILKNDDQFEKDYYTEWPLFREFRKQQDFSKVYLECYNEEFVDKEYRLDELRLEEIK